MLLYGKYFQNRQASFGSSECKWVKVFCQSNSYFPQDQSIQGEISKEISEYVGDNICGSA